jgi:hypothetical protein
MSAKRLHSQHILFLRGASTRFQVMASSYGASHSRSLDTPHSVGLLWTSDQPDTKICTGQHTTLTTYINTSGGIRTHHPSKRAATGIGPNITYVSAINYEHAQQGTLRQIMYFVPNVCFTHIYQMQLRADFPSSHSKYNPAIPVIEYVKKYILYTNIFRLQVAVFEQGNRQRNITCGNGNHIISRTSAYFIIKSMSIIVQQDATIYSLLHFCKLLALHVSCGYSTHHQEHI